MGRYVIHIDDNIWAEGDGFWVRGGRSSSVHVSPGGATRLRVRIRNGDAPGPVALDLAGQHQVLELAAGEVHEVDLRLTGDELTIPLTIMPTNGSRPIEHDPTSRDRRWLGCLVMLEPS